MFLHLNSYLVIAFNFRTSFSNLQHECCLFPHPGPKKCWENPNFLPRFQPCQSIGGMSSFKAPFKASKLSVAVTTGLQLRILFQAQGQSDSQSFDFGVFLCASKKELIELKKKCEDHSFYIKGLKKNKKQIWAKVQKKKKSSPKKNWAKGNPAIPHITTRVSPRVFLTLWCRRVVGPCRDVQTSATHPSWSLGLSHQSGY